MTSALVKHSFACLAATMLTAVCTAQDIVVEACQSGQNSANYAEISGQWSNGADPKTERSNASALTRADTCSSRKLNTGQTGEARFYPRFTAAGHYCVYVTWPSAANAKQVVYVTRAGGAQSAKTTIQNGVGFNNPANGNRWIYIGEWDFKEGGDDYIALIANAKDTTPHSNAKPGMLFADAVRFVQTPLTAVDGAELLPRDRVEFRAQGTSVPPGAAPLLNATPSGKAGASAASKAGSKTGSTGSSEVAPVTGGIPGGMPLINEGSRNTASAQVDGGGITWMSSLPEAQRVAGGDRQKRILIYFHAKDTPICIKYDGDVFTKKDIIELVKQKYVPVKLEMDQSADLANALGVYRGGTLLVYDNAGTGLKKITKNMDSAETLQELQF